MPTAYLLNFSCASEGPKEPNTAEGRHFDHFHIKLFFAHILNVENPEPTTIVLDAFRRTTRCPRPLLLSGDEHIRTRLHSFLSGVTQGNHQFLGKLVNDIIHTAQVINDKPVFHQYKSVKLIVTLVFSTPYDETSELDRAILESSEQIQDRSSFTPASEYSIKSLKRVRLADSNTDDLEIKKRQRLARSITEGKGCTICLEDINSFAVEMPCRHFYHEDCIVEWLKTSHFCPLCRYPMPVAS